nr:gustatory receptor for sugar taste 64f-like [Leptinotarsa decemlineata]
MKSWCRMDKIMNINYGYPEGLDRRLQISSLIFMLLGISDYCLGVYSRYNTLTTKFGNTYDYQKYYVETFPQLFNIVPINIVTAGYCSMIIVYATLIWTFNDLFIIMMSMALAMRFKQVTQKIVENINKAKSEQFWIEIRVDYDRLSIICKELDDHISCIVLLSYTLNIFFLLDKVYKSLEFVSGMVERLHFIFSFLFLILRVGSVSLYGAWINDESVESANVLNSVPSDSYNIEIKRLLIQINFDNVALTGCRMFKVTRGIILSIAGAVVTYELVLIQFNAATNVKILHN